MQRPLEQEGLIAERQLQTLIEKAEQEKLKIAQRLESARRANDQVDQKIAALKIALEAIRMEHGIQHVDANVDSATREEYVNLSSKDQVIHWADSHNDSVVMDDIAQALADAGIYADKKQAYGTLSPAIRRMDKDFVRVARGRYSRVRKPQVDPAASMTVPMTRLAPISLVK